MNAMIDFIRRGLKASPQAIGRWLLRKLKARRAAKTLPGWQRWLGPSSMAAALDHSNFEAVLATMRSANPFPGLSDVQALRTAISDETRNIIQNRAKAVLRREIDMLGSGPVTLTTPVDWTLDFKSNIRWSMHPSLRLPINQLGKPSDIKVPWELSRLQWLLPVGQAYVLDGDEEKAAFAREIIEDWMISNPVCRGPNWICAMDVALRAISMIWLFHACKQSDAWKSTDFLERLLKNLILHGKFIDTNLEYADINGNHLTTDLAGLTIIGIALGGQGISRRWVERSWRILCDELHKQVTSDGVDFEGSLPYHRLVAELFLLPALARRNVGLNVDPAYLSRLTLMGHFTRQATMPGGEIPVWGDADDGRALPLGTQSINDHRYLAETLQTLGHPLTTPKHDETLWWLGVGNSSDTDLPPLQSTAFDNAGVYVLRNDDHYVFIDAGPVGMAGRGGHGHNDCLSFCACLNGTPLIIDAGAYVYTADWQARNRFRATSAHNTPEIDGEEINRFNPRHLWHLNNDAVPDIRHWRTSNDVDCLIAAHSGYQRLESPVTPVRGFIFEKNSGRLAITDHFEGQGAHTIRIPYTFAPGCRIEQTDSGIWRISYESRHFTFIISDPDQWQVSIGETEFSPSYGIKETVSLLELTRHGPLMPLSIAIMAESNVPATPHVWLESFVKDTFSASGSQS